MKQDIDKWAHGFIDHVMEYDKVAEHELVLTKFEHLDNEYTFRKRY